MIADRGFPFWPQIETVDISLVDNVPRVLEVLQAIRTNFVIGNIVMAEEFRQVNDLATVRLFEKSFQGIPSSFEPHQQFKLRVPSAIGSDPNRRYHPVRQYDFGVSLVLRGMIVTLTAWIIDRPAFLRGGSAKQNYLLQRLCPLPPRRSA